MNIKRKLFEIRNINNKVIYGCIVVFVLFLTVQFAASNIKLYAYRKESKPFTDKFLNLLMENKYERIYEKYSDNNKGDLENFKEKFNKLNNEFGRIISYEYKRTSASTDGTFGRLVGFSISYTIYFENGKNYNGTFSIEIDKTANRPKAGRITSFEISGNFGKKYLPIRIN